jgi:Tectonin domain
MKMKNAGANMSKCKYLTTASWKDRTGQLCLIVFFLCSAATSAAAQWALLPTSPAGVNLAGIQVGSQAWGRDGSGNVYEDIGGTFTLINPANTPQFAHITVGVSATPLWGIAEGTGKTYHYNGSSFVNVPLPSGETFDSIGAAGEGVWAVNSTTGHVFTYQASTNSWEPPATGEPTEHFESISAGNFGTGPWAIDNNGGAWLYNSRTGFFDAVGGFPSGVTAQQVTVGHGQAWALSSESSNNVYMYDENPTVEQWFHPNPFATPTLSEISESTDESLWGVSSSGQVYLFNTTTILFGLTAQPQESIFEVKVGTAGVFALSSGTGHVYLHE